MVRFYAVLRKSKQKVQIEGIVAHISTGSRSGLVLVYPLGRNSTSLNKGSLP